MRIIVPAHSLKDVLFMSMATTDTMPPKTDYNTGEHKTAPNGKPLFNARGLQAIGTDQDGNASGADTSVTLALTQPTAIQLGMIYRLAGEVTITHYVQSNNRLGVSIIADSVEPIRTSNESK